MHVTNITTQPIRWNGRRFRPKTRAYIWPKGETAIDNIMNRRNRPIKLYREMLCEALDQMGVDRERVEFRWSRTAGCGCGCSPGFIIDGYDDKLYNVDLYIDFEG